MNKEEYSGDYQEHLLQQYLSYVESSKEVSKRRLKNNKFFVTLLSSLAVFLSYIETMNVSNNIPDYGLFSVAIMGSIFSFLWSCSIWSYRQINSGKYKVISDFEEKLPFNPYDEEWEYLKEGEDWKKYLEHTKVELMVPIPLTIIFIVFAILNCPF